MFRLNPSLTAQMFNKEVYEWPPRAKLQNTGPLLTIHQTSELVWLGLRSFIYYRAKRAAKYMNPRIKTSYRIKMSYNRYWYLKSYDCFAHVQRYFRDAISAFFYTD